MIHEKVRQLKLRSREFNYSMAVDADGNLIDMKPQISDRVIKGYLMVWGIKDTHGTIFTRGCCAKSIQEYGPQSTNKYKTKFLWQHDLKDPLCNFTVLEEDDYGLYFECEPDKVPNGNRAVDQIKSGTLNQFSTGFDYVWDKVFYDDKQDALVCPEIVLFEGSVVTLPSNLETYAIRSQEISEADIETYQEDVNAFLKTIPRHQQLQLRQLFTRQYSLYQKEPLEQLRQALKDEKPNEVKGIDYKHLTENFKF